MAEDNVPPNPSTPPPPTSEHKGKLDIPELEDAKLAGSPYSESCTLILTEGYPAKNFAMSGDKYGVFPLNGKLLNVRDASPQQLLENAEIQNVNRILGLQDGKSYENVKELRYGHLMIMANQGRDSLHIVGLLINFLHYFWPSLLKVKNFMSMVVTPILKASAKKTDEVSLFYTMPEYKKWHEKLGDKVTEYDKITNFQGPETIEIEERAEYLDQHIKDFVWINDHDGEEIEIAFSKKLEVRKEWLRRHQTDTYFDSKEKRIRYLDFISIDFKQYVVADLRRSIPSMVDGLKPYQRKILFFALKLPNFQEIEGAQFGDFVFKHCPCYHHGEESLDSTIIGMAQNYVSSNNINLLQSNGQFGTRLMGGKDHDASGTCLIPPLSPITRYLFPKDDELILHYLNDDSQSIEPAWLYPIIPMVLVNGSEGRGIVCSSFIPKYNPRDIISNLKRLLNDEAVEPMLPWYNGFKGEIEKTETPSKDTLYTTKGMVKEGKNAITITELPIGTWTHDYKEFLEAASRDGKDIKAYTARHGNTNNVHFEITMTEDQMNSVKEEGFLNKFKLTTTLSTANMNLLDANDQLQKYDTPEQILEDFFHVRLELYEERRSARIRELEIAILLLENKAKFIGKVCEGEILVLPSKEKDARCAELKDKGFQSLPSIARMAHRVGMEVTKEEELRTGYDYLLSTPVISFTYEKMKELEQERDTKNNEFHELTNTSSKSLWLKDLDALIRQLDEKYPLAEKRAPAKRAPDAAEPQRANKKILCSE